MDTPPTAPHARPDTETDPAPPRPAMSMSMSVAASPDGLDDVYAALERYGWDDDVEFQAGLSAILGTNSTPEQAAELALRARCFYYARYPAIQLCIYIYIYIHPSIHD